MRGNFFTFLSSFFVDRLIFQSQSEYNKELKVQLRNGKYILNSGVANYSFGSLHTAFQRAFSITNLKHTKISNALILGFGAGSVAAILRKELNQNCKITGVEIDKEVIEIGQRYFHLGDLKNCEIIQADAFHYLENSEEKFDLLVVDLFHEIDVPRKFISALFLKLIKNRLQEDAFVFFNFVVDNTIQKQHFEELEKEFKSIFSNSKTLILMESNRILFYRTNKN